MKALNSLGSLHLIAIDVATDVHSVGPDRDVVGRVLRIELAAAKVDLVLDVGRKQAEGTLNFDGGEIHAAADAEIVGHDGEAGRRFELSAAGDQVLVDLGAAEANRAAGEESRRQVFGR